MKILVTGGCGYVGRVLSRRLLERHQLLVFDSLRHGVRFSSSDAERLRLVSGDIRDGNALEAAMTDFAPEIVVHLAAIHFIPECEEAPDEAIAINTLGTANVLRLAPPGARVVNISTAAVYAPSDLPHRESSSEIRPMDVYGLTKLHGEHYVQYWAAKNNLRATSVRLFNVIGPGETNPHVIPAIVAQLRNGDGVLRLGNVHPKRDYIHVEDVASALERIALDESGALGKVEVVNLGTGVAYSVLDIVAAFERALDRKLVVDTDMRRVRHTDRPMLCADTEELLKRFMWSPARTLDDAIGDVCEAPDLPAELLDRC